MADFSFVELSRERQFTDERSRSTAGVLKTTRLFIRLRKVESLVTF